MREVHFVINTSRNVGIVFNELFKSYLTITLVPMSHVVMLLESFQELAKNLLFCFSAINNSRMLFGVIGISDFSSINNAASILIKDFKSRLDHLSSEARKLTSDSSEELVILNGAVSVRIKGGKKSANILLGDVNLEVSASLFEFHSVKTLTSIVIHNLEDSLEANDTSGSSLDNLLSEALKEKIHLFS